MSRRNRLLAAVVGSYLAKVAADRLLWRGVVRDGESLVVTVRQPGSPADPGAG
jgi:nucleotide-binding universal stress UspA family protein